MSDDKPPKTDAEEFLTSHERERVTGEWQNYLAVARQNFLATIDAAPYLWEAFQALDVIWKRELENTQVAVGRKKLFPTILMTDAHVRFRTAIEIGFSARMHEAWNIFRSTIECAVHAHKLYREPKLVDVWMHPKKNKKAYDDAFTFYKEKNLFPKEYPFLNELKEWWDHYSEWGTHTSNMALALRSNVDTEAQRWNVNYFDVDPRRVIPFLYTVLICSWRIENTLHDIYSDRFALDHTLVDMRKAFEERKAIVARTIATTYNIPRPTDPAV